MAVDSDVYFEAIGRAGLVFADAVLENIGLEKSGCSADWDVAFEWCKKIECAEFYYRNEDYAESTTSAYLYRCMLSIAGTKYTDAEVDPNAQLSNIIINASGSGRAIKVVADSSSSNLTAAYLNATYTYPDYQEGDIVYLPNAFLQYTKLENTEDSEWAEAPLSFAG